MNNLGFEGGPGLVCPVCRRPADTPLPATADMRSWPRGAHPLAVVLPCIPVTPTAVQTHIPPGGETSASASVTAWTITHLVGGALVGAVRALSAALASGQAPAAAYAEASALLHETGFARSVSALVVAAAPAQPDQSASAMLGVAELLRTRRGPCDTEQSARTAHDATPVLIDIAETFAAAMAYTGVCVLDGQPQRPRLFAYIVAASAAGRLLGAKPSAVSAASLALLAWALIPSVASGLDATPERAHAVPCSPPADWTDMTVAADIVARATAAAAASAAASGAGVPPPDFPMPVDTLFRMRDEALACLAGLTFDPAAALPDDAALALAHALRRPCPSCSAEDSPSHYICMRCGEHVCMRCADLPDAPHAEAGLTAAAVAAARLAGAAPTLIPNTVADAPRFILERPALRGTGDRALRPNRAAALLAHAACCGGDAGCCFYCLESTAVFVLAPTGAYMAGTVHADETGCACIFFMHRSGSDSARPFIDRSRLSRLRVAQALGTLHVIEPQTHSTPCWPAWLTYTAAARLAVGRICHAQVGADSQPPLVSSLVLIPPDHAHAANQMWAAQCMDALAAASQRAHEAEGLDDDDEDSEDIETDQEQLDSDMYDL